jgi:hypothetical protein
MAQRLIGVALAFALLARFLIARIPWLDQARRRHRF